MFGIADAFEYEYRGCDLRYGRGRIADLGDYLAARDLDRAVVVCGSNVGANDDLMDPLREGLGDRLAAVFDGTTPEKQAEATFGAIDAFRDADADVFVGVGGGSSLDVTRQASVLAADGRTLADLRAEAREGDLDQPDAEDCPPVVVVPTTFAGADVSSGGSTEVLAAEESPTGQPIGVYGSVTPIADFADPALFETTPAGVLAGSAMNGFDKGIETTYARDANPVSDATAVHGLRLLSDALPRVADGDGGEAMERAVTGALLVQVDRKISAVHAFGHGFARRYDVQQGAVHAVAAPHVLEYLFEHADASRHLLADALGVSTEGRSDDAVADAVVDAVAEVRNALDVPRRFGDLPGTRREDVPAIAEFVVDDPILERAPAGLDPTVEEVADVLRAAW